MTTPTKGCCVSLTRRVSNGLARLGKTHGFSIEINSNSKVRVSSARMELQTASAYSDLTFSDFDKSSAASSSDLNI
jgi:hypothetical protein